MAMRITPVCRRMTKTLLYFLPTVSLSISKMNTKHARNKTTLTLFNSLFVVRSKSTRDSASTHHTHTHTYTPIPNAFLKQCDDDNGNIQSTLACISNDIVMRMPCTTIVTIFIPQYLFDVLFGYKGK